MTISWLQAIILGIFASLSPMPGMGGTSTGSYILGRPLIGGLVCRIVLGNIELEIACGAAMQLVYITLVTPGGTISADVRTVSYIGTPLAVVAIHSQGLGTTGADAANLVKSMDTLVGTVGIVLLCEIATMNLVWQHVGWKDVEKGKFHKLYLVDWAYPWISHIYFSFIPTLIMTKLGTTAVTALRSALPVDGTPMKTLFIVGAMLPCVGIVILPRQIVNTPVDFTPFLVGFTSAASLRLNLASVAIASLIFAFPTYQFETTCASEVVASITSDTSAGDDEEDI